MSEMRWSIKIPCPDNQVSIYLGIVNCLGKPDDMDFETPFSRVSRGCLGDNEIHILLWYPMMFIDVGSSGFEVYDRAATILEINDYAVGWNMYSSVKSDSRNIKEFAFDAAREIKEAWSEIHKSVMGRRYVF